jgi:inositol transporter-like SP family MFS transporter
MVESAIWTAASAAGETEPTSDPEAQPGEAPVPPAPLAASRLAGLFSGPTLAAIVFTATVYLFWNLAAGTFGVFSPYILKTIGTQSQAASVALSCAGFVITLVVVVLIFMPFSDRSDRSRRIMWGVGPS